MKHDNCKDCVSKCEHAGKDREFIVGNGVSCKVTKNPIVTKADRIRAMSDEELAEFLSDFKDCAGDCLVGRGVKDCSGICATRETLKMWLQQPCEGE